MGGTQAEVWKVECSVNAGGGERLLSNCFLKILTERAVTPEAGSEFQYSSTLTENGEPLLRRWLATWSTLKGCLFGRVEREEGKTTSD